MTSKQQRYHALVEQRKRCIQCGCYGLVNQSKIDAGQYDYDQIGSWSLWQGNLDADIMIVGQDWGSVDSFRKWQGYPTSGLEISITNRNLLVLLDSIGRPIAECTKDRVGGPHFFTNSVLCIKPGKWSDKLNQRAVNLCSDFFLKPLIDIIEPKVVVTLSRQAYLGVRAAFQLKTSKRLSEVVQYDHGIELTKDCVLFPRYHCGGLGLANRNIENQKQDWQKIRVYLDESGATP